IARMRSLGGALVPPPGARSLDTVAFAAMIGTVSIALPAARAFAPKRFADLDPVVVDLGTSVASIAFLLLSLAASIRARVLRRLELGVADRALASSSLALTALLVGVLASFAGVAPPERTLPETSVAASIALAVAAAAPDPTSLARATRVGLWIAALAAPIGL